MKFNFKDINECTKYDSNRICGQNGKCINHYGSYSCECLTGFVPIYNNDDDDDGFECEDIDECSSQCLNTCDFKLSVCVNLNGDYECKCKKGFRKETTNNGKMECIDIDECSLMVCDKNAFCQNFNGSFECKCMSGFYGNGFLCEGEKYKNYTIFESKE